MSSYRPVCSFCGCSREEVGHLIVSSNESAAICDGCVGIAVVAIEEAEEGPKPASLLH
jgi:ATP-dependent protease Clp ATPase subunit